MALVRLPEHKNADFVLEMPENRGSKGKKKHKNPDFVLEKPENGGLGGQKRTKTLILCSKRLKMRGPKAKSAQKWDFCALFCFERPLSVGLDVCG